jgi:hypothetical protein
VADSLRPESVLGQGAPPASRAIASSAFTALINSFFVSLIALIPHTNLGYTATTMALISLYSTWRTHHELSRHEAAVLQLVLAVLAYVTQLGLGIALTIHQQDDSLVYAVAYVLIGSFAVALRRAWSLMQGSHLPADQASRPSGQEPSRPSGP